MKKPFKIFTIVFVFLFIITLTSCGKKYQILFKSHDETTIKTIY